MKTIKIVYFNIAGRDTFKDHIKDDKFRPSIFPNLLYITISFAIFKRKYSPINPILLQNTICFDFIEASCYKVMDIKSIRYKN